MYEIKIKIDLRCDEKGFFLFAGRYAEAQNMANDLLRSDSMNADAMYVRGLCLYYEDFVDKAFTHFQQVLRLAPDHQRAKATYKVSYLPKFAQYYVLHRASVRNINGWVQYVSKGAFEFIQNGGVILYPTDTLGRYPSFVDQMQPLSYPI